MMPSASPPPPHPLSHETVQFIGLWHQLAGRAVSQRAAALNLIVAAGVYPTLSEAADQLATAARSVSAAGAGPASPRDAGAEIDAAYTDLVGVVGATAVGSAVLRAWEDAVSASHEIGDLAGAGPSDRRSVTLRLPTLRPLQPKLIRTPEYLRLSPKAQLVLTGVAGETGLRPRLWSAAAIRERIGPMGDPQIDAALDELALAGWVERQDWGGAPEGRGRVLLIGRQVFRSLATSA